MTFFELSLPFEPAKQKGKDLAGITPGERQSLEARIDAAVHLGYTIIAINHIVQSKFTNAIPDLALRKREGIVILKRLTIVLDDASEKNCGLVNTNTAALQTYDIISVLPTTTSAFSLACLTYSLPGTLTTHIITLDLSSSHRLPFYLKHTLVRTAIRNGAVFEVPYASAISSSTVGGQEEADARRKNWWANAREVMRVTKGKNVILSSAAQVLGDLRAPLDVANLVTLLDVPQNLARDMLEKSPKSLVLRAQTRKTYRAVLSEPVLVLPTPTPTATPSTLPLTSTSAIPEVTPAVSIAGQIDADGTASITTNGKRKRARNASDASSVMPESSTGAGSTNGAIQSAPEAAGSMKTELANGQNTQGDSKSARKKKKKRLQEGSGLGVDGRT